MDWCGQRSDTSSHPAGSTHNRHTPNQRGGFSWPGGPPMQGFPVSLFHLLLDFQTHKYLIVVSQLDWIQFYCIDIEKNQDGFIFFLFQSQFSFPGVPSFPNFTGPLPHSSVSIYLFSTVTIRPNQTEGKPHVNSGFTFGAYPGFTRMVPE